jgi:hypothetical protein
MSEQSPLTPPSEEVAELAAALRGLSPAKPAWDRDHVLFEAGRASAPRAWPWQLATGGGVALSLLLAAVLVFRPAPAVERVVYVQAEPTNPDPLPRALPPGEGDTPPGPEDAGAPPKGISPVERYRQLQQQVLHWGLEGGMPSPPEPGVKPTVRDLLDSL